MDKIGRFKYFLHAVQTLYLYAWLYGKLNIGGSSCVFDAIVELVVLVNLSNSDWTCCKNKPFGKKLPIKCAFCGANELADGVICVDPIDVFTLLVTVYWLFSGRIEAMDFSLPSANVCVVISPLVDIDNDRTGLMDVICSILGITFREFGAKDWTDIAVVTAPIRFTRFTFVNRFGLFTLILANGDGWFVSS